MAEAAASPEQDDTASTDEETPTEEPSSETETSDDEEEPAEAENAAGAWTDEQLLGAGWTQEQIDTMRNG